MNEGWLILGGVLVGAVAVSELAVRLFKAPEKSFLWRLGRGCSAAVKSLFVRP